MKVDEKILLSIMEFIKTTKALKEMKKFFQRPFCVTVKINPLLCRGREDL